MFLQARDTPACDALLPGAAAVRPPRVWATVRVPGGGQSSPAASPHSGLGWSRLVGPSGDWGFHLVQSSWCEVRRALSLSPAPTSGSILSPSFKGMKPVF